MCQNQGLVHVNQRYQGHYFVMKLYGSAVVYILINIKYDIQHVLDYPRCISFFSFYYTYIHKMLSLIPEAVYG